MLSAGLAAAALPLGLILVFAGFTAVRAAAVLGPPVVTLPAWGCAAAGTCAVPGAQPPPQSADKQA
jgi:hypothetical protein